MPAVSPSDPDGMTALIAATDLTVAVVDETDPATVLGFALLFRAGADYASENYRWFSRRTDSFLYVDRIIVAPDHRGLGLGAHLYSAVFDAARALGTDVVFCEVNLRPANPESLAFHDRLGFTEIGQQATKNDSVLVSLLSADVSQVRSAPPE